MKDACACLDRSSWFSELWTCLRQKNSKAAKQQQQSAQYQYQAGSDISVSKYALDGWRLPPLLPLQRSEVQVRCNSPASIKNLKMNPSARCGAGKNYIKYTHTHIHIYIHIYIIFLTSKSVTSEQQCWPTEVKNEFVLFLTKHLRRLTGVCICVCATSVKRQ